MIHGIKDINIVFGDIDYQKDLVTPTNYIYLSFEKEKFRKIKVLKEK
jgi:hypothetical protein